jgi:hypothetical protein
MSHPFLLLSIGRRERKEQKKIVMAVIFSLVGKKTIETFIYSL